MYLQGFVKRRCPACGGNLYTETEEYQRQVLKCLQCTRTIDLQTQRQKDFLLYIRLGYPLVTAAEKAGYKDPYMKVSRERKKQLIAV